MKPSDVKSLADLAHFDPQLCVIKLGSAVLTTGVGQLDMGVLERVAEFVSARLERGKYTLIVSSGAVASGIGAMGLASRPKGLPAKQALAAIGQTRLVASWGEAFAKYDRRVAQLLLTAKDFDDRRRYLNIRFTLEQLFEFGVVPIFNENDTVTVDELRFGDNDNLACLLAVKMMAESLIILSGVDGLYRSMPKRGEKPDIVEVVPEITPEIEAMAGTEVSSVGTGGMASKLAVARHASHVGIPTILASGKRPGILKDLFAGKGGGTLFLGKAGAHLSRRERFIAFNRISPRGRVFIDDGAVKALVVQKKSLLPAGVKRTEGDYARHDVIEVVAQDGHVLARGMTNYAAAEVEKILGRRTGEIEKILGARDYDEIIHRDNLVVIEE
ncbi:TPA: glutamate 5-kinase [Candidatus Sumerlaeota bacterium]|jgi:glutamate 5-kinase|nr:glutamate 5-kinase [Candidatus Sumerlaeota bacterium]